VSAPAKKPVLASNADWAQGVFSRIFVDGHTTIGLEQVGGLSLWSVQLLTRRMADVSGLTVNVALNVVELANPVERLTGNLGFF
jgi:hypothetical protein